MTVTVRDLVLDLADFSLDVSVSFPGGITALFGPSGAGKTTLVELIAGLRRPASGRIELDGRVVCDTGVWVAPRHRRVGYVPQDDALFPHLSVGRNIAYGGASNSAEMIEVLEIGPLLGRSVLRLSGGERKRVALARALATRPEVLLLDEPLAGVDLPLRDRVLDYLRRIRDEIRVPTIYVTHHIEEAEAICDAIVVLERGRVMEQRAI